MKIRGVLFNACISLGGDIFSKELLESLSSEYVKDIGSIEINFDKFNAGGSCSTKLKK